MKGLKRGTRAAGNMDPRLVILSRGPGLYSTKQLAKAAEEVGWAVRIIDPLKLTVLVDDEGGKIYYKGWPLECEAVIPRIGHSITRRGVHVVRQLERMGVIVINSSSGIAKSRDKLAACQLMTEANVPVPITANVGTWKDTVRAVNQVGGTPCVVKSNEGTHGSGVFLAHTEQQAKQLVYQMLERDMRPLVQEYIQESHGKDIRALVVGGRVVAAMRRRAHGSEFRSNFHLGGSVEPVEMSPRFEEIAVAAANKLGLDLAGVDMLEAKNGPLVLEVNSSPGLEGIESVVGEGMVAVEVAKLLNRRLEESRSESNQPSIQDATGMQRESFEAQD
ncbi:MAG: 30S ribosomal protein S6--L-glutamate ligase [Euryarchaeota archaeon]|nr:30S ribosomal protein S6--L-glutamate ligase [Euryarchaeota archaeon]